MWRHPFASMREEMNDLFERLGMKSSDQDWPLEWSLRSSRPAIDVCETDNGYEITAELPGMSEKDFDLTVRNGNLTLSGKKKHEKTEEKEEDSRKYHVTERSFGSFRRSMSLPEGVDEKKIAASFENGVLTVSIPVSEESKSKTRKIPIKAPA